MNSKDGAQFMKFKSLYIWYSLPVIVVLIWILAIHLPLSSRIKEKEKNLVTLKKELEALDANISSFIKKRGADNTVTKFLQEYAAEIPVFNRFPEFIKGIIKGSNRYGVVVVSFNSAFSTIDKSSKQMLTTPAFDITVKGRFMDIAHFLEMLTEQKAYKAVKKAELSYDEREYPILTGRFLVEFKAWERLPKIEAK